MGGYEPGPIEAKVERLLSKREQRDLDRVIARTNDLRIAPAVCDGGYDGARWIMESARAGDYRYADRQSPKTGPVHDLGLAMLQLTGWSLAPIY